tara:strand:+ start:1803 stop:2573 length:771 start_codon:yes stop_codon:yes gene_type:complete
MRLSGKRSIITGAAKGIGRAVAQRFAAEGAMVTLVDQDADAGKETTESIRGTGGQATFIHADLTDESAVRDMVVRAREWMNGIDTLINNAGLSITNDLLDIELDDWNADLEVNLSTHFLCTRAALPVMIEGGGGTVVSMSSVNGIWAIGETGYSAAKAGLISFIQNVAVRYGESGIRANVICPGTILSKRCRDNWEGKAGSIEKLKKWYPVGRLGEPEDVASLAVFLASDESSFISGTTVTIDGGLTAGNRFFGKD